MDNEKENNSVIKSKRGTNSVASSRSMRYEVELKFAEEKAKLEREQEKKELEREQERKELEKEQERREFERRKKILELKEKIELAAVDDRSSIYSNYSLKEREQSPISKVNDWITQQGEQFKIEERENDKYKKNITSNSIKQESTSKMHDYVIRQSVGKDLPIFNGNPSDWLLFITNFKTSTQICRFSEYENAIRLQKSLKGDALESVKALLITNNVNKIIRTLEQRFGRPEYIIDDMIINLTSVSMVKEDQPLSIIKLANATNNLTAVIESLGKPMYVYNPHLIRKLSEKLPASMKLRWGKYAVQKENNESLLEFANWLDEEANAASILYRPTIEHSKPQINKKMLTIYEENIEKPKICMYCKNEHYITQCPEFKKLEIDSRWTWVRQSKICFSCLRQSHQIKNCLIKKTCGINNCKKIHHRLLHSDNYQINEINKNKTQSLDNTQNINFLSKIKPRVLLKIIPVTLYGVGNRKLNTYALLDDGSTITVIRKDIADILNLDGPNQPLSTRWKNSVTSTDVTSRKISIQIQGTTQTIFKLNDVRTDKDLKLSAQNMKIDKSTWTHLQELNMQEQHDAEPTILIGSDNAHLIASQHTLIGKPNQPVATLTALGWVLNGKYIHGQTNQEYIHFTYSDPQNIDRLIKNFWTTDSFGVKLSNMNTESKDIQRAKHLLNQTTKRCENGWETGLLWKEDNLTLPESRSAAEKRLFMLEKKMAKDPEFKRQYYEKINYYITQGFARRLSKEEETNLNPRTWYIPHFGIINPNKPKIRVIFDAAARSHGVSLNDKLLKGPDQFNNLVGVIFVFRQREVAIGADIKDMFLRIKIREEDRHSQRFLFRNDETKKIETMEMVSMLFGATSSPCSAQEVKNRNAKEFKDKYPDAYRAIVKAHYMDDYLDSMNTVEEAVKMFHDVSYIHLQGGFEIRNWISNSERLQMEFNQSDEQNLQHEKDLMKNCTERVLGLQWKTKQDTLGFATTFPKIERKIIDGTLVPTKREALRVIMTMFDPLGLLAFITIKGKILMQEIWRSGINWDQKIPEYLFDKWQQWLQELSQVKNLNIPRSYGVTDTEHEELQLHIFSDASDKAFAAAAYLRVKNYRGIKITPIMGKTRVSPLKPLTIPRLELQGAVMSSRMKSILQDQHTIKFNKVVHWTDSKIVLSWLRADAGKFKTFVANRIGEILENSDVKDWRWISSKENVADDATRDSSSQVSNEARWFQGPSFLYKPEEEWPQEEIRENKIIGTEEFKVEERCCVIQTLTSIPDITRFSKWTKLLRTTAWMLRFVECCKGNSIKETNLTIEELEIAEQQIWRQVQQEIFPQEIEALKKNKQIPRMSNIKKLVPMLDKNGLLRLDGRIKNAPNVGFEAKYPLIIIANNQVTQLLLHYYHCQANHGSSERVINEIRQKYWIPKIRNAVRKIEANCQTCRILKAKPYTPRMGILPVERVTPYVRPFAYTGMDYFGPMIVTIGRRHEKRYGVLFTCLTTRAVHVEITQTLNTDSAIMAIRRMMARRGKPFMIYSDNGTNLRGADAELKSALNDVDKEQFIEKLTNEGIKWKYIPPGSPHMGGCWERLVGSIKRALRAILKEQAPREEVLQTLLAEAEFMVNSRPITKVSEDPGDLESLTPNHFLLGSSTGEFGRYGAPGIFKHEDFRSRKQWRISQIMADSFWKRWIREYLPTINTRSKWREEVDSLKEGDVVIIWNETSNRGQWPKGVIIKTYPGKDGRVRIVDIRTAQGEYKRPVTKLCLIHRPRNKLNSDSQQENHGGENVDQAA